MAGSFWGALKAIDGFDLFSRAVVMPDLMGFRYYDSHYVLEERSTGTVYAILMPNNTFQLTNDMQVKIAVVPATGMFHVFDGKVEYAQEQDFKIDFDGNEIENSVSNGRMASIRFNDKSPVININYSKEIPNWAGYSLISLAEYQGDLDSFHVMLGLTSIKSAFTEPGSVSAVILPHSEDFPSRSRSRIPVQIGINSAVVAGEMVALKTGYKIVFEVNGRGGDLEYRAATNDAVLSFPGKNPVTMRPFGEEDSVKMHAQYKIPPIPTRSLPGTPSCKTYVGLPVRCSLQYY